MATVKRKRANILHFRSALLPNQPNVLNRLHSTSSFITWDFDQINAIFILFILFCNKMLFIYLFSVKITVLDIYGNKQIYF